MDGENNGKPYCKMDDFGGTTIFGNIQIGVRTKKYVKPPPSKDVCRKYVYAMHVVMMCLQICNYMIHI